MRTSILTSVSFAAYLLPIAAFCAEPAAVSYDREIRPIFQAHCQGCHQPAKPSGGYVMTSFSRLMQSGESRDAAVVPGKPDASALLMQIVPVDGKAAMPKDKPALSAAEIALIRKWIEQGAKDDSPAAATDPIDHNHPPVYDRPPVVTSLEYSPDGSLLAVAGFHEVILLSNDSHQPLARLVGLSERIEAVAFSPDGQRLAVAGGKPARQGEVQIWNVPQRKLELSIPVTFDTVYGVSWSPDGKLVAVGCSDTAVRGFDSHTGKQVFFNGAHDDWPLDTVFSTDGSLLVSVGRDMSTKLYSVPTERFIDNVTSITPGALKGGISAVARHPQRNEIVVGGSDGIPRFYRMERVTKRVIGDDANLIRRYPAMPGRIYAISFAPDGKTFACASSLDGQGHVAIYSSDVPTEMPEEIKKIVEKVVSSQSAEEKAKLEKYVTDNAKLIASAALPAGTYALAFHPYEGRLAIAGSDGRIRLLGVNDAQTQYDFVAVPNSAAQQVAAQTKADLKVVSQETLAGEEKLPSGAIVQSLELCPTTVELNGPYDSAQLLVTGILASGERIDLTRLVQLQMTGSAAGVSPLSRVYSKADGQSQLSVKFQNLHADVPVTVDHVSQLEPISFIRDVNPVLTRLGCNQGTCHGAKDGKNGFKLSLRGYDPIYDVRAFTDDLKGRRTNVASPENSLMLLKATGSVPHVGGQLTAPGEAYYEIIRRWIADGSPLDQQVERVTGITIEPQNPVVQQIGARQQLRVVAKYSNGRQRDVTGEAFLQSGNTEVAENNRAAVVTAIRRGEAPILARFEGSYAATTLTVMGDRQGFVWKTPETWGPVDELVAQKWERMKILPSELCSDEEFLRRVSLDLTGLPPSADEVVRFMEDPRPTREKRDEVVDRLIGSDAFIDYWTNKWADLLQVNSKYLGTAGASEFRKWIRQNVAENRPYDKFCFDVITASGSNKEHPAASYYKILREPDAIMENTTHLFLGVRFNCNKCHDHPFERWTQDQYYETAAYFAQVGLKRDPKNADGNIGGTAVEGAKPMWEEIFDKGEGEMKHDRTGAVTAPLVPFDRETAVAKDHTRRQQLAEWMTSSENDYFARSYVNRIWGYLMGVGFIEPLDDIRAGNPASNPELLDKLTRQFVESSFNVRELMRTICKSRVYQLDVAANQWNADDKLNYSHALPKRLPAEVLYDSVYTVTGSKMKIPGVPEGTRAAALPDVQINLADGFLDNLGRPVRESACECERSADLQLGPVMALMNGTTVSDAISQPGNMLEKIAADETDMPKLVDRIFLNILNRHAHPDEIQATITLMGELQSQHNQLASARDAYREQIRPVMAASEERRLAAVAKTEQELADFQKEIQPRVDMEETARQEKIKAAQLKVDERLATGLQRAAEWEAAQTTSPTPWTTLKFGEMKATNKAKLEQADDNIVLVSGPNGKVVYTLQTQLQLDQVAALQLEALMDEKLPGKGPGRSEGGNFVLSELTVEAWPVGKPDEKKEFKLQNAKADFSQGGYGVETAVDGKAPDNGNGWAVSPEVGKDHYASFEFAEPAKFEGEIVLQIKMSQQYTDAKHSLGKFRFSATNKTGPVNLGLPAKIVDVLAIAADVRTDEQEQVLIDFVNSRDADLTNLKKNLAEAKKPLPDDPHVVELRERLDEYKKPLPPDPQLERLERAARLSEEQLKNNRLTAAQDLAWALINSPAFLFNR
ncbi:DUF1549 domain-containing protein [Planctomicrobium piriforme]|uniref:WD40 repeat n=1 Tax=Planctomicrobium piriforme TaxID=1576369 RepID=A0A1I3J3D7_9PLAN|nr:DUF1549 domain-containing protein [Planctomicrobium piriforme]SFI54784.1 WD40 repeat [Planctomicrobium piriforme]